MKTEKSNPNYQFVEKLKELWNLIDNSSVSKFIDDTKYYDLYPLRNVLENSDEGYNRFNMEEMADAGEAYGELLELIRKDLAFKGKENMLKDVVKIPLEKHYTCRCGKEQVFPYDDDGMMLIVIGDIMMSRFGYEKGDSHQVLIDNHQNLPNVIQDMLTGDLDFHQKEHLKKCRYQPDDWKTKSLRLKGSSSGGYISPDVISLNLTWQQSSPEHVLTTMNMIPSTFKLSDMFEIDHGVTDKKYYFKGMIGFWGNHYYGYIRHITKYGEHWIEYNDKSLSKIPSWEWIVEDSVTTCSTPTLLVFENIDTVKYKNKISSLSLSEDFLEEMQIKSYQKTRAGDAGRIDMTKKSTAGIIMEGAENFPTHSGPDVAYSKPKGGLSPNSGPIYGVTKSHTREDDDEWRCSYCYKFNEEGT